VSLDQLLADAEPARESKRPRWLTGVLVAAGAAGGVWAVLRVFGFVVPFTVLVGAVVAVALLRKVLAAIPIAPPPAALRSPIWGIDEGVRSDPPDGVARAVRRWEARFAWTDHDVNRYVSAVRPKLVELVDERLRQRHGVTMRDDPERARAILGAPLWTFLHAPPRRGPTPAELAAIVAEVEKI
jgi:hypothetical protein